MHIIQKKKNILQDTKEGHH